MKNFFNFKKIKLKALILLFFLLLMILFLSPTTKKTADAAPINELKIHFINVGQADCILIQQGTNSMLIDGGYRSNAPAIIDYLKNQKIYKINYIIGTHFHDDHIGGLINIVSAQSICGNTFQIDKVFLPKTTYTNEFSTNLLSAMKYRSLTPTYPMAGQTFPLGDAVFTFLTSASNKYSSGTDNDTMNNSSLVIKLQYKNRTFLFTGDAEDLCEEDLLKSGYNLSADVLKLGHHGSATSTSQKFLDAVNPKYAVATVGNESWCKLPTKVVLNRLAAKKIPLYRTDENGTIVLTCDGTNITFNCEPGSYLARSYDYR